MSSDELEKRLDELMGMVREVAAQLGKTKPFESRVVTYDEAAKLLKKSRRTIERMVEDGILLPSRVEGRIPLSEIDKLSQPIPAKPSRGSGPKRETARPARETAEAEAAKVLAALKKPKKPRA